MERQTVFVRAVPGGWVVESPFSAQPLMFLSGARAEAQARRLAHCLSEIGLNVSVQVHDRRDDLVGTVEYKAA